MLPKELEKYLDPNTRMAQSFILEYFAPDDQEAANGICYAITCLYLCYVVEQTRSAAGILPIDAFLEMRNALAVPDVREFVIDQQKTMMGHGLDAGVLLLMPQQFSKDIQKNAAVMAFHAFAHFVGSMSIPKNGDARNPEEMVKALNMAFQVASNLHPNPAYDSRFTFVNFWCKGGGHAIAVAMHEGHYYIFDCNFGVFIVPPTEIFAFFAAYQKFYGITNLFVAGIVAI